MACSPRVIPVLLPMLAAAGAALTACSASLSGADDLGPPPSDLAGADDLGPPPSDLAGVRCGDGSCEAGEVCVKPACCCRTDAGMILPSCPPGQTCDDLGRAPTCQGLPAACHGVPSCACGFMPRGCENACDGVRNGQVQCGCGY